MLSENERLATAASIAATQLPNGTIPWTRGSDWDPWDHVECALALDCAGMHRAALAAYRHLFRTQRHDGAWACPIGGGPEGEAVLDSNGATYASVGVWHHYLCTRDEGTLHELWPMVERGIDFVLGLQFPSGAIGWARNLDGHAGDHALLASSSCIVISIRCALQIAHTLGDEKPDWELSLASLAGAIARGDTEFADRSRYSMDWYYPVLSGVLDTEAARTRIASSWDAFVVAGLGARCVVDRPWVTSAETAELAIALHRCGLTHEASELFERVQYLRAGDGSYWTGATFPDGRHFPHERSTWSGAANLLASDVLQGRGPIADILLGDGLAPLEIASDALADTT